MFGVGRGIAAVIGLVALGIAAAAAQEFPSFKGKTIIMLIGDDPGGGTDVTGRLIALYLHKYLPGEPGVVVQNMAGASGMAAMNFLVRRTEPNGLTVLMGSISIIDPVLFKGKISDPIAQKAFNLWTTLNTGDKWLALVQGTPDAVLAAYRDAFDKLAAEPEFLGLGEKISEGFTPMSAPDVEVVVRTLADTPGEAVEYTGR
jgi:hypothetical protein